MTIIETLVKKADNPVTPDRPKEARDFEDGRDFNSKRQCDSRMQQPAPSVGELQAFSDLLVETVLFSLPSPVCLTYCDYKVR